MKERYPPLCDQYSQKIKQGEENKNIKKKKKKKKKKKNFFKRKKKGKETKQLRDSFQSEQKGNKTMLCIRMRGIRDSCQAWDY